MDSDFRVRFETKDGILLKNRKADPSGTFAMVALTRK
jgi:hypothetical protein